MKIDGRYNKNFGTMGEDIATSYLESIGYKIIKRNFRCRQGEIDIIAQDKKEYVFIEVKTRSTDLYGIPREAVNTPKKKHIYKSTKYYLYKNRLENSFIRFDVIEIYFKNNKYIIKHLKQVDIND